MGSTIVEKILEVFGVYTAIQLTNMTHAKGTPWDTVVSQIPGGRIPANLQIPDELIREHFKAQMS